MIDPERSAVRTDPRTDWTLLEELHDGEVVVQVMVLPVPDRPRYSLLWGVVAREGRRGKFLPGTDEGFAAQARLLNTAHALVTRDRGMRVKIERGTAYYEARVGAKVPRG